MIYNNWTLIGITWILILLFYVFGKIEEKEKNIDVKIQKLQKEFEKTKLAIDTLNIKLGYVRIINNITIIDQN